MPVYIFSWIPDILLCRDDSQLHQYRHAFIPQDKKHTINNINTCMLLYRIFIKMNSQIAGYCLLASCVTLFKSIIILNSKLLRQKSLYKPTCDGLFIK